MNRFRGLGHAMALMFNISSRAGGRTGPYGTPCQEDILESDHSVRSVLNQLRSKTFVHISKHMLPLIPDEFPENRPSSYNVPARAC